MLARYLWRLLHSWWRRDRIRVSPLEGRLLRLVPPCVLVVDALPVEVVRRTIRDGDTEPTIVYGCRVREGHGELIVRQGRSPEILWRHEGAVRRLHESDIA